MANIKISQLTAAAAALGTQEFEVNEGGSSKKVTGAQVKTFVKDGLVVSDITDLTSSAAELNILDGVTATTAELNFVDGVTSAIQTQLDAKAPIASPTFTGTTTSPTFNATDTSSGGFQGIGSDSAAAPSFTWSGDLDTGIYRVGTNSVGIATGGTEKFRIASNGAMGIGGANYGTAGQVLTSNGSTAPSWENVGSSIADMNVNAVGSYALLRHFSGTADLAAGSTAAGSQFYYASAASAIVGSPGSPTGTWRTMGDLTSTSTTSGNSVTVCLRIS